MSFLRLGCYEYAKPEVPEAISDSELQNVRVVNPEARSTHASKNASYMGSQSEISDIF
jgi:hypothetical protein